MARPDAAEHIEYFGRYIALVPEADVVPALEAQLDETARLLGAVGETKAGHRYAPGKWSVRQVVGHVGDWERIFGFRLLAIARGETQPLPGHDEKSLVENGEFDRWSLRDLSENLSAARRANLSIIRNLPHEAWDRRGVADNGVMSVRAFAYTMLGHERHHVNVLRERYLA